LDWRRAYARAEELLDRVRIAQPASAMRAFPHQLSGGQRQRVAIAAAIAAKPTLLIADEATSALDVVVQAEIVNLLDGLVREEGMTLLFITHDIALASGFADRIAVFRIGELVEAGPIRSVLSSPADGYTAALIASHRDLSTPPLIAEAAS
jgi:peptide/nickel transport system ATP-binding protein